ncbi:hypothetical protein Agabi119p4_11456 [Agaricus bisporus var. burnettii]|uniref:Uncharacterized protein n=1 Tax=Agaricus bisporus var. burnettii TaxID=192524 RepID=A0A8H7EUU6_AGABI|nr:hypothetical protein Agabi119p4_11456 [Agaricus bisporus var. burnettii]
MPQKPSSTSEDFVFDSSPNASNPSFERVLLKQYAAEQERKHQGKQHKFLQQAEKKLSKDINLTKETTQTCIEQLENLYSTFILDYASCEDTISLLWNEVLNLNETYASVLEDIESNNLNEMEENQVLGLSKIRSACEDNRKVVEQMLE